jgi:hypothetical protein
MTRYQLSIGNYHPIVTAPDLPTALAPFPERIRDRCTGGTEITPRGITAITHGEIRVGIAHLHQRMRQYDSFA